MRILVCGGRDFSDRAFIERTLTGLAKVECIDAVIEATLQASIASPASGLGSATSRT